MTDEQKLQIRKLREQGMGYKTIASMVNLTRDSVRSYCKTIGIGGYRIEYEMNLKERMMEGRACAFCGAEIKKKSTGRPRRFCSDLCRRNYWKIWRPESKKSIYTMQCAYCHEIFESYGNKTRKYCCHEHYILDRFGPKKQSQEMGLFFNAKKE